MHTVLYCLIKVMKIQKKNSYVTTRKAKCISRFSKDKMTIILSYMMCILAGMYLCLTAEPFIVQLIPKQQRCLDVRRSMNTQLCGFESVGWYDLDELIDRMEDGK